LTLHTSTWPTEAWLQCNILGIDAGADSALSATVTVSQAGVSGIFPADFRSFIVHDPIVRAPGRPTMPDQSSRASEGLLAGTAGLN
jgi:hypothetical protein